MADPEIAKRNARRNYKTTANEEFDANDERKKAEQNPGYSSSERNSQGDTFTDWAFSEANTRRLKSQIFDNEYGLGDQKGTKNENRDAGYYQQAPKFAKGGMVKAGSPRHTAPCRDSKTIKC